ncbi:hypothetical protein RDWZM_003034 [Blomia tropicalis]|uniref:Phosphatidylinositol-specific phospholipase C X domain-containing protein n=1 Tax=Blomia tropicalis TaxID=40697 RepID=A0A9Q0MEW3_BLOTA|nr:hypothetical protein RDWZM_003034 [Blomia tropicalis]
MLIIVSNVLNNVNLMEASVVVLSSPRKGFPLNVSPQIWLSISSKPTRRLVLNWHRLDKQLNNSWIALYDHEPTRYNFPFSFLERVHPHSPSGKHLYTSKSYEHFTFQSAFNNKSKRYLNDFLFSRNDSALTKLSSSLWSGCVKYWIAYIWQNKQIVMKKCLSTRPRWMEENMQHIGHRSLLELALPGTHNAGSYEMAANRRFARLDKYIYCQDESIWNQLVYGVRFFDLRLSFDEKATIDRDRVWIAHGMMRIPISLADVLEQVLAFMLSTRQEIIVLDFHRFEDGLQESLNDIDWRHAVIERLILDYVGAFLVPVEFGMVKSLRELTSINKRIFVGYARDKRNRRFFHTNSLHVWAETDDSAWLFRYLNDRSCRSPSAPYLVSLMGALTPRLFGLIRDKYDGVRALAEQVNHQLSVRVFEEWWQCMNVLSTDYFLGNNAIEFAIEANLQRERRS